MTAPDERRSPLSAFRPRRGPVSRLYRVQWLDGTPKQRDHDTRQAADAHEASLRRRGFVAVAYEIRVEA